MTDARISSVRFRPAHADDEGTVRQMIRRAGINPFGLSWERFIVAEAPDGQIVGCGQLKEHKDGSLELASLAVRPAWQGRGLGSQLVDRLVRRAPSSLWLMCRSSLTPFYRKHGFREVPPEADQPPYFARVRRLADAFHWLRGTGEYLAVMHRTEERIKPPKD